MTIKFLACYLNPCNYGISREEIEKETPPCVWIKGQRHIKVGDAYKFFDTFREAQSWLADKHRTAYDEAKVDLEDSQEGLDVTLRMTEENLA